MGFKELKREAYESLMEMTKHPLGEYTPGSVSAFDRNEGVFAIKPLGQIRDSLRPSDMIIINLQGRILEGAARPAQDAKIHLVLYSKLPELGGVCHTYSPYACAWAQAAKSIPVLGFLHAVHLPCDVPCTEPLPKSRLEGDYELEVGASIVKLFSESEVVVNGIIMGGFIGESSVVKTRSALKPLEVAMALISGHGPIAWGADAVQAVEHACMLEEIAKVATLTGYVNAKTPRIDATLLKKMYERRHKGSYYYSDQAD